MIGSTTEIEEPKAKWWVWGPIGAAIVFVGFGLAVNDYEIHASNARKICEAMAASGTTTQPECDKPDTEYGKALSRHILDRLSGTLMRTTH